MGETRHPVSPCASAEGCARPAGGAADGTIGAMPSTRVPAGRGGTALVLGGGGMLGAAEVGMLRALFEHQIRPDLIVGTAYG